MKELLHCVQELRTLIAAMQLHPFPEMVLVTIFMEGLRMGVARTEVFRVHPTSFEADVDIAFNAEFNFKAARFGTLGYNPNSVNSFSSFNRPEPMDLSLAETDEEADLRAVEQQETLDDVSRDESQSTCDQIALYAGHARLLQAELPPLTRCLVRCRKT